MSQERRVTRRTALRSGAVAAGLLGVGTGVGAAQSTERCYYQIDFVEGPLIETLGPDPYEFYGEQNRLIQYLHGDESGPIRRDTWINSLDSEVRRCVTAEPIRVSEGAVSVEFTVADGCERTFSLGVYLLPGGEFSFDARQELLASATGTFGPGRHELSIDGLTQIVCPQPLDPYEQLATLTADEAEPDDQFASSIAVSDSGDTAVVGAPNGFGASEPGSAYVFTRTDGGWTRQTKLTSDDPTNYDNFGWSVAISGSGDTAVVSTIGNRNREDTSGSAYVFTRTDDGWTQQTNLTAEETTEGDIFGWTVAISGETVAVGAPGANRATGSTYVYARADGTWGQQAALTGDDPTDHGSFGYAVGLSNSGDTAIISAPSSDASAVYAFDRTDGTWTQQVQVTDDDTEGDSLGYSLAISEDIAVADASSDHAGEGSGAVYVFARTDGTWARQAKLTADDAAAGDWFGTVAVSGETVVVGAQRDAVIKPTDDGDNTAVRAGSAYVFTRTDGTWTQQAKLTADDPVESSAFGRPVAVSDSGRTVVVGGVDGKDYIGLAYVFGR